MAARRIREITVRLCLCILVLIVVCVGAAARQAAPAKSAAGAQTGAQAAGISETPVSPKSSTPPPDQAATAGIRGIVRDSAGRPAADAIVLLDHSREVPGTAGTPTQATETLTVHTTGKGAYRFSGLPEGAYTLHAQRTTHERTARTRVDLVRNETKTIDLEFLSPPSTNAKTD
ncbi:MAG: carboxypeptidase-like regulatory domain-containing protein [Terriglobales bacterium]